MNRDRDSDSENDDDSKKYDEKGYEGCDELSGTDTVDDETEEEGDDIFSDFYYDPDRLFTNDTNGILNLEETIRSIDTALIGLQQRIEPSKRVKKKSKLLRRNIYRETLKPFTISPPVVQEPKKVEYMVPGRRPLKRTLADNDDVIDYKNAVPDHFKASYGYRRNVEAPALLYHPGDNPYAESLRSTFPSQHTQTVPLITPSPVKVQHKAQYDGYTDSNDDNAVQTPGSPGANQSRFFSSQPGDALTSLFSIGDKPALDTLVSTEHTSNNLQQVLEPTPWNQWNNTNDINPNPW